MVSLLKCLQRGIQLFCHLAAEYKILIDTDTHTNQTHSSKMDAVALYVC